MRSNKAQSTRLDWDSHFHQYIKPSDALSVGYKASFYGSYFSFRTQFSGSVKEKDRLELDQLIDLLGRRAWRDIVDLESKKILCNSGQRLTLEMAQDIRAAGLLEVAIGWSHCIRLKASPEDELYRERGDFEFDVARDRKLEEQGGNADDYND